MGNNIRTLSDAATLIAADDTWLEGNALQQLLHTAALPGMQRVCGMPDLHPGRGYPVGAAFLSAGRFYPALVGNDIGCGMALWQTDLGVARHSAEWIDKKLGSIDGPLDDRWAEQVAALGAVAQGHEASLGTIGGGNHFAEWQAIDRIDDADALDALGIAPRQLLLLVHSGSRGLGQVILRDHVDRHGHGGLVDDGDDAGIYLQRHTQALAFARANRELIALRMLSRLRSEGRALLDVHHNFVEAVEINGQRGWLHRKGATPSDRGAVVIPGSRGDYSYLVRPQVSADSLWSLAHGAGRKWQRSDCKGRLSRRYTAQQLSRTALGSRVVCDDRALLYEEAPEAYKPIDSVVGALQQAGLLSIVARLRPVLSYKTRGCC